MADSSTYTPETYARRLRMAEQLLGPRTQPIQHWAQGLEELAKGYVGGRTINKAETDASAARKEAIAAALASFGGGEQTDRPIASSATIGAQDGAVSTVQQTGSPRPVQVIENGDTQPSPLDPPSGKDRDIAIRTMYGEDPGVSASGVANVMRRRAIDGNFGGNTLSQVALAKNQFEPWNTSGPRARMEGLSPDSPTYQGLGNKLDMAYAPGAEDPTNGSTHFFAPKAQAALGRDAPKWAQGPVTNIGPHAFYGGNGQPAPTQVAGPVPPREAPAPNAAVASALAQPQAQPQVPRAPQNNRAGIISALMNPWTPAPLANALTSQLNPSYGFQTLPDGTIIRTNPKSGTVAPIYQAATKPSWGVIGEDPFGNKQYGWIDAVKKTTEPGNAGAGPGGAPAAAAAPITVTDANGKVHTVPTGQDPKKFREHMTAATADAVSGKLTEAQTNATQFANRMEDAEKNITGLEGEAGGVSGAAQQVAGKIPVVGAAMQSGKYQKFEQAKSQFITALLRKESGAAISPSEFSRYEREFFPVPGNPPEVIEQKRHARQVAIDAMKKGAGPIYKSPDAAPASAPEKKSIGGKNYVKQNGQWFEE